MVGPELAPEDRHAVAQPVIFVGARAARPRPGVAFKRFTDPRDSFDFDPFAFRRGLVRGAA